MINATWKTMTADAVALRRSLHANPELTWQEHNTAQIIRRELDRAGIAWRECAGTGSLAVLAPKAPGRHIALRADMDAMPITEATDLPWASAAPGCMHACGHDGHIAALTAAGWWLKKHESRLPGPVTLIFQPAEEGGHGARSMIENGALDGVDAVFGWHNWPAIPMGKAICPDGPVMAANGTFRITIRGRGAHASQPEAGRDPVLAASAVVQALQQIVSRRLAPQHAAVVSVTSIVADSPDTVIPEECVLGGCIRFARNTLRPVLLDLITETAVQTASAYGTEATVEHIPRYGAVVNEPESAGLGRAALKEVLGTEWLDGAMLTPVMASEDFSYYLEQKPGAFMLMGAGEEGRRCEPCHSPRYDFNDALIPLAAKVFFQLVKAPMP